MATIVDTAAMTPVCCSSVDSAALTLVDTAASDPAGDRIAFSTMDSCVLTRVLSALLLMVTVATVLLRRVDTEAADVCAARMALESDVVVYEGEKCEYE